MGVPEGFLGVELPYAEGVFGTRAVAGVAAAKAVLGEVASMHQVHGAELVYATEAKEYGPCDGLFTDVAGLWLAVKTADCTPCLISTPKAVAALHLGWRSAQAGLLPLALALLQERFAVDAADVHVALGPALGQARFEVEAHFPALFGVPNEAPFFAPSRDGHVLMSLGAILQHQARMAGVLGANVRFCGPCTYEAADLFFSYRRDRQEAGRQVSAVCYRG